MPSVVENTELVVDDISIAQLSDDELYQMLVDHGLPVGPVVDSTRDLYRQKLRSILANTLESGDSPSQRRVLASVRPASDSPTMERRRPERNVAYEQSDRVVTKAPVGEKKKADTWQSIILLVVVAFFLIVGYIFYQEVAMYSAAEKEFLDSQNPNMNAEL